MSALILARDEGERLSEDELLSTIFLLRAAGHDTTVNLIGTGTLALLTHPAELARLRANPSLIPHAVEELLRYASPVNHATYRIAAQDVRSTAPSSRAVTWCSSRSVPPTMIPAVSLPDALDLGRDPAGHVAFGHGIHYVWEPRWPAWRGRSRSARCLSGSVTSRSRITPRASSSALAR